MNIKNFLRIVLLILLIVPLAGIAADIRCTRCGSINEPGVNFCGQCGTKFFKLTESPSAIQDQTTKTDVPPLGTLDPSVQQLIGQLSDQDLRRIVAMMLQRIESRQERFAPDPNSVASMSRQELEDLLQKYSVNKPVEVKSSPFTGFLQFVGGMVLLFLTIAIITSL